MPVPQHEHQIADREDQQVREVNKVVGPQAPAGDEPVVVAEGVLGPGVDAALLRVACRQVDDRQTGGNEEAEKGEDPERQRGVAVAAGRGQPPAQPDDSDDVEEDEVPQPELAPQAGGGLQDGTLRRNRHQEAVPEILWRAFL